MDSMPSPVIASEGHSSWRTLHEWFNEPHDYEWIKHQRSGRAIIPIFRTLLGMMTIIFGLSAFYKLIGPDTPPTTPGQALSIFMICTCVGIAACWFTQPFPGRRGLLAFGIFADLGIAAAVLLVPDRSSGTFGCIVFAVTGTFATLFVSAKWLVAHVVWSTTITTTVFVLAYLEGDVDITTLLARGTVLFGAVTLVPIFAHLTWRTLYRDAQYSDRDPLTGLFNRRGLEGAVGDLFESARDDSSSLAFIVVDIDKFKTVNDLHGHAEGDHVIRRTANRLSTHLGERGVIARTGGEEYLAVIAGNPESTTLLIEGINAALSDCSDAIPTTVSVGAVMMTAESKAWSGGASAILAATNVADSMMYQAKAAGGNTIRSAQI